MQTILNSLVSQAMPMVGRQTVLDRVNYQLQTGPVKPGLDELFEELALRRGQDAGSWREFARGCQDHGLRSLLHMDPFTYRAFSKPRGYAGDAVMMDYIYGLGEAESAASDATPLGRAIFEYMGHRPSARAVRYRRSLIAGLLDQAAERDDARVLAVAAGHLREVELSDAVRAGAFREFVAFDQDEASLSVIARDYGHLGITAQPGSVRQILARKSGLGQYDLVYAAGLYDYLNDTVAAALTRRLFDMTRPGGKLLIPNFLTGIADVGYMEAFMDWHLIYRNQAQMFGLAAALPLNDVADVEVFNDPDDTIVFLLVTKAEGPTAVA